MYADNDVCDGVSERNILTGDRYLFHKIRCVCRGSQKLTQVIRLSLSHGVT